MTSFSTENWNKGTTMNVKGFILKAVKKKIVEL